MQAQLSEEVGQRGRDSDVAAVTEHVGGFGLASEAKASATW